MARNGIMKRLAGWVAGLALLAAAGVGAYFAFEYADPFAQPDQQQDEQTPPPNVTVTSVEQTSVKVERDYAGRVQGAREVQVRARVEGILEQRLYREGEVVDQGEPLFRIDPEPFETALQASRAELQTAEAQLRQAEREWERTSGLFERGVASEQQHDNARSERELAEARLAAAEADVARAQLELDWTEVEAPLSGVTRLEAVPEGSLVERGTLLTTIVQHDPVHVRFALPEDDAAVQRAARRAMGSEGASEHRYEAQLLLPDGAVHPTPGEVDFTASTIDPRTGTVSARAVYANPDNEIVPGQFVRVRIEMQRLENVFMVPVEAIAQDQEGPLVFVIDDETAEARPVRLGPMMDSRQVVLEGLEPGERIVVSGHVTLQDGMAVSIMDEGDDAGATEAVEPTREAARDAAVDSADGEA